MGGDLVRREEAQAALQARRELGPDYEEQIVDALVEKIERRLAERQPPKRHNPAAVAIPSLAFAIPLLAVAGVFTGLAGVIAVSSAIVLVNLLAARR